MDKFLFQLLCFMMMVMGMSSCSDEPYRYERIPLDENDYNTMIELYDFFKLSEIEEYSTWKFGEEDPYQDTWKGITFVFDYDNRTKHVEGINISVGHKTFNRFPIEITRLSKLKSLEIAFAYLNDKIPAELFNLPLEKIKLWHCKLHGPVPNEILKIKECAKIIDFYSNSISELPDVFGDFENAEYIDFSHNKLKGKIPDFKNINAYIHLEHNLYTEMDWDMVLNGHHIPNLSFNQLRGEVPDEVLEYTDWENIRRNFVGNWLIFPDNIDQNKMK